MKPDGTAEYRDLPTGCERRFKNGRVVQIHWRDNPGWARKLLERMDEERVKP